jgi:hypothetical protein
MAVFYQLSGTSTSNGTEMTFKNYTGSDIPAGTAVKCDTSNPPSNTAIAGVVQTSSDVGCIGICLTTLPAGKTGIVRLVGPTVVAIAGAAITYGVVVMANSSGQVVLQTSAKQQIGIALSTATVSTDAVVIMLASAINA